MLVAFISYRNTCRASLVTQQNCGRSHLHGPGAVGSLSAMIAKNLKSLCNVRACLIGVAQTQKFFSLLPGSKTKVLDY
jgi:hypothetical protein